MKTVLNVKGMKCGGCEATVQSSVGALEGVVSVKASHKESRVEIEYEEGRANLDTIRKAITDQGFELV